MHRRQFLNAAGAAAMVSALPAARAAERIRFVQSDYGLLFFPVMVAQSIGAFDKEGISAEFITNLGGAEALSAVVGGNAEIYVGAVSSSLRARQKGTDAVVFGAVITRYASNVVLSNAFAEKAGVNASSPLDKRVAALRGATVAVVGIGSGTHQLLLYLAKRAGIDTTKDLKIVSMAASAILPAYKQGRIDAYVVSSPTSDEGIRQSGGMWVFRGASDSISDLDNFPYVGLIAREKWITENPKQARAVTRAVNVALQAMHDPVKTLVVRDQIYEKYNSKGDRAMFNDIWAASTHAWPDTTVITPDMAEKVLRFLNTFSTPMPPELAKTGFDYTIGLGK